MEAILLSPSLWIALAGTITTVGGSAVAAAGAYLVGRRHGGAAPLVDPGNTKPIIDMGRDGLFSILEQKYGLQPVAPASNTASVTAPDAAAIVVPAHPPLDANSAFKQLALMLQEAIGHLAAKPTQAALPTTTPPSDSLAA